MSVNENPVVSRFKANAQQVYDLLDFDEKVLEFLRTAVSGLVERQASAKLTIPPQFDARPLLKLIEGVRAHDSLERYYLEMFNQCAVLLVSHFASAARSLYVSSIAEAYVFIMSDGLLGQKLEVTVGDLSQTDAEDLPTKVGEILANRQGTSWQDMKSIGRAFKDHLDYEPARSGHANNIGAAQGLRNAIVHSGAFTDERLIRQLDHCVPRTLKPIISAGEKIQFTAEEVGAIGADMLRYLEETKNGIDDQVRFVMPKPGAP